MDYCLPYRPLSCFEAKSQIRSLYVSQLEALGEALLDFCSISDLSVWFQSL